MQFLFFDLTFSNSFITTEHSTFHVAAPSKQLIGILLKHGLLYFTKVSFNSLNYILLQIWFCWFVFGERAMALSDFIFHASICMRLGDHWHTNSTFRDQSNLPPGSTIENMFTFRNIRSIKVLKGTNAYTGFRKAVSSEGLSWSLVLGLNPEHNARNSDVFYFC